MTDILYETALACGVKLQVVMGDITAEDVDAVVNAANSALAHGGGVAGALIRAGGVSIQEESYAIAPVTTGSAKSTTAGKLKASRVIHAVGPRTGEGNEDMKLASAVRSALDVAHHESLTSVSMPAISSGIFGYPKDRCAEVLLQTTLLFFQEHPDSTIRLVRFCNFDQVTADIFLKTFQDHFAKE